MYGDVVQNNQSKLTDLHLFYISAAFLLISGIASLTYQVTWVRLLGLSMGSTSAAISTVLAAFFLGLASGSYLAERITRNRINDLKPYIILEIVIGVSGLLLLPVLLNLDSLMALSPSLGSTLPMKFIVAMVLLILPTLCMGATFPVMASIMIRRKDDMGRRMSQLYSLNTAGAVFGACLSGFVFIPAWGLDGSIFIAFVLNLLIVVSAIYINRSLDLAPIETATTETEAQFKAHIVEEAPFRIPALIVLFFTGFVAIATEVGWTKYLVIFAGTTIYGFASILTIFLIGIAAGSWAIKSKMESMQSPQTWMAVGLVLLGGSLLLTRAGLSVVPNVYQAVNHLPAPDFVVHMVKYGFIFMMLIVPTFIFGALFPINLRLYCGNLTGIRSRIGKAYAVNTLASIFGSILAGFFIIPTLGTDWLLTWMAVLILVLPFLFIRAIPAFSTQLAITVLAFVIFFSNWSLPHLDYKKLIASVGYDEESLTRVPEFLFLKEGKAGVVSMVTYNGRHAKLQNNGLNESYIDMEDSKNMIIVESLLGFMPYFFHEDPKNAFVVGFGGGITTKALTHTGLESIRVVELEPSVVEAGRAIVEGDEIPALLDERVTINFNDARNTLLLEEKKYDIIVAQPSHPWRAGAANVFTKEFFEVVKSRLNEDGIYGQWINLFNMDVTTLRALMQSYVNVFPEVVSFSSLQTGDFLMFGSRKPIKFDLERVTPRFNREDIKEILSRHDVYQPVDLLWYFGLSKNEILQAVGESPMNTDTNILSEVRLSRLVKQPSGDEDPYSFLRSYFEFDVLPYLVDKQAPQAMYDLGLYFANWDSPDIALKVAKQLTKANAQWGHGLEHEILWRENNLHAAIELFNKHNDWGDGARKLHIVCLVELGRIDEAQRVVDSITGRDDRSLAVAYLLHATGNWRSLAGLKPRTDNERMWQLIGLAKIDLKSAGIQLQKLMGFNSEDIPALRVLVQYASRFAEANILDKYSRQLAKAINKQLKKFQEQSKRAIKENDEKWAQAILHKMEALNANKSAISKLREEINKLKHKDNKAA